MARPNDKPTPARPFMHWCACGAWGCYGLGDTWFCRACAPRGFLPGNRVRA